MNSKIQITQNDYNYIGKTFETKQNGLLKVISVSSLTSSGNKKYLCEFIDTGTQVEAVSFQLKSGEIKDKFRPSVCGVGYMGNYETKTKPERKIYQCFRDMLRRCYDKKDTHFNAYGGRGVSVDVRWHCFEYFIHDVTLLPNWNEKDFSEGKLQLDKDIKIKNNKIYSKDTCVWVSPKENMSHQRKMKAFKAISPEGNEFVSNNQTEFAKIHNLQQGSIARCLKGDYKTCKGWIFEYIEQ